MPLCIFTCNKRSVLNSWRHAPSPSAHIQLSHVITYTSRPYVTTKIALCVFHFFTALFSWVTNKNFQHDHCSSICNALMKITRVIKTFAICHWYHFHQPWFSLQGYLVLVLFMYQNFSNKSANFIWGLRLEQIRYNNVLMNASVTPIHLKLFFSILFMGLITFYPSIEKNNFYPTWLSF